MQTKQSVTAVSNSGFRDFACNIYRNQIRFSVKNNEVGHSKVVVKLREELKSVKQTTLYVYSFSGLTVISENVLGLLSSFHCRLMQF
jgi:hypothetical protein